MWVNEPASNLAFEWDYRKARQPLNFRCHMQPAQITADPDIRQETILRRYMDLPKLLDLLHTRSRCTFDTLMDSPPRISRVPAAARC